MISNLRKSKAGFTLIELMIVVSIIGVLSAIAIPNFLSYRTKGQDAAVKSAAKNFYNVAMAYFADSTTVNTVSQTQLSTLGLLPTNPNITGDPTLTNTAGIISIADPNWYWTTTIPNRIFVLAPDGTIELQTTP